MSRYYDYVNSNKMERALAEILEVDVELIEELGVNIEENIGNNDFLYGYYVEFPKHEDIVKNLKDTYDASQLDKIPWGETEFYNISAFGNTNVDPFGWLEDWKMELYYYRHTPSKENITNELNLIKDIIAEFRNDETIVKSLVLSAFSITESYMRSIIRNEIPDFENSKLDYKLKDILRKHFVAKLNNNNKRIELYKDLTGKALNIIPNFSQVRNALAHNMFAIGFEEDCLIIENADNVEKSYKIKDIINQLIDYVKNPFA